MARPKSNDYPKYMYFDKVRSVFVVENPVTGKKTRTPDESLARRTAEALAQHYADERQREGSLPASIRALTVARLVERYIAEQVPHKGWKPGTRRNNLCRLNRIKAELGNRFISETNRVDLAEWLNGICNDGAETFNKYRHTLKLLWAFAESENLASTNEADMMLERSMSKNLVANRVKRATLDIKGFWAIHEQAPDWLKLAMELSLITLQSRNEVCNMEHVHFKADGRVYVVREKVSSLSDAGFVKIKVSPELLQLKKRSYMLDAFSARSPYGGPPNLVHRKPFKRFARQAFYAQLAETGKEPKHWTYVVPHYLSQQFRKARDKTGLWAHLPPLERPGFHRIRKLASQLLEAQGAAEGEIQALMTHSNPKTTQIYTERGREALTDDDFRAVDVTLSMKDLR